MKMALLKEMSRVIYNIGMLVLVRTGETDLITLFRMVC